MTIKKEKNQYDNKDINSDWMLRRGPSMTGERNFYMNMTKGKDDTCVSIPCHSRAMTRGSREKRNHYFLDSRIKYENDNLASSTLSSSCLTRRSSIKTTYRSRAFRFAESGRSMVEMLGTLAVMGVLSIGGIMGYSYSMDKYRANTIINDIMLRSVDVIAQFDRTGKANLSEWPTTTAGKYTIGLENDTIGIYVSGLPEHLCQMVFDGMINNATVKISTTEYNSPTDIVDCDDTNTMFFYVGEGSNTKTEETTTTTIPVQKFCTTDAQCGENEFCGDKGDTIEYMEPYICKSSKYTENFIAGKTIYVLDDTMTWQDAKTVCAKLGGQIPTQAEGFAKNPYNSYEGSEFSKEVSSAINSSFWVDCLDCGEPASCGNSCVSMGFVDIGTTICIVD